MIFPWNIKQFFCEHTCQKDHFSWKLITTNDRKSSLLHFVMGFYCIFIGLLFQLMVVVNFLHFNSVKFIHCAVCCTYFYSPQTKFAKLMFLHVSVCPRGEYLGRYTSRAGRYTSLVRYTPWAGKPPGQVHPLGRYTPWVGTPPGQVPPSRAGTSPRQVQPPG